MKLAGEAWHRVSILQRYESDLSNV